MNMKYIKRFEHIDYSYLVEIKLNLKEIFQELSEDNFDVFIKDMPFKDSILSISIYKDTSGRGIQAEDFHIYEVKEYLRRALDYLITEELTIKYSIPYGVKNNSESLYEKDIDKWGPNDVVMAINIYFEYETH